jgi:hypothetical protein
MPSCVREGGSWQNEGARTDMEMSSRLCCSKCPRIATHSDTRGGVETYLPRVGWKAQELC